MTHAKPHAERPCAGPGAVALLGVPSDENSSLLRGPAAAPAVIRSALYDPETNMACEDGRNLAGNERFVDVGDLALPPGDPAATHDRIVAGAAAVLDGGGRLLALGGDHGVSYPLVRAHFDRGLRFAIVQIDAHPDLYADFEGNRFSHASGFCRIAEEGLTTRIVQVGIRAATPHQREQASIHGIDILDPGGGVPGASELPAGPVYLSLDLDGLDPAFAPGVSHPEAGGLSTRDALDVIRRLPGPLVGADIVEYNPRCDVRGATALVAAKFVREITARLLRDLDATTA